MADTLVLPVRIPSGGREMIVFVFKIVLTFFVILCFYWGAVELLWEENKISDEWHDFIQEIGTTCMVLLSIGGIVAIGLMLIWCLWKGV